MPIGLVQAIAGHFKVGPNRQIPRGQAFTRAKLGPVNGTSADDIIFTLNPNKVRRTHAPRYALIPVALADFGPASVPLSAAGAKPFEWTGNSPEEIRIEFLVWEGGPDGADEVEDTLRRLDKFMLKDGRTGEPPDLVFTFGHRHDVVRIHEKDVEEQLWTWDLRVEKAQVSLVMKAIRSRQVR